jgi:hypothetical protein
MKQKQCSKCNDFKDLNNFAINKATLDKLDYWCRSCRSEYHKKKYPRKMKKMIKTENTKQCRNCEQVKSNSNFKFYKGTPSTYCKDCTSYIGHIGNILKYGITPDEYLDMLKKQDNCCYICKSKDFGANKKRLSIDHNHSCHPQGKGCKKCIRKLLCHHCNAALGNAKDSIEILEKMISYLKEHSQN